MRASRLLFVVAFALGATGAGATIHHFTVPSIDEAQETPPTGSSATGSGVFDLDDVTGIATFNVTFTGLSTPELFSHVHTAPPGVPGPIQYFLPNGSPKIGSSPVLTPVQQADMIAGNQYVNIHSVTFPAGEIRGQIIKTGATQFLPTKRLLVRNPGPTTSRKIVYLTKVASPNSLAVSGNPTTGGAKLKVKLDANTQCFDMPSSGWTAINGGFRYKDMQFVNGPVKVAIIKKPNSGVFLAKFVIQSRVHPITVIPPNPGVQGDTNLTIGGPSNEYCGSTAGGVLNPNHDKTFKAKDAPAPTGCNVTPCSPSGAFLDETLE